MNYEELSKKFDEKLSEFDKDFLDAWLHMDQHILKELNPTMLFLDDIRNPDHCLTYIKDQIYGLPDWIIVRNYNEFVNHIEMYGLPDLISFDHDLADSHYTPKEHWETYEKSKAWQDAQVHTEKTGYECAKWLVEYCMDRQLKLPAYLCHSMNPVGKDNILGLLKNFEKII